MFLESPNGFFKSQPYRGPPKPKCISQVGHTWIAARTGGVMPASPSRSERLPVHSGSYTPSGASSASVAAWLLPAVKTSAKVA